LNGIALVDPVGGEICGKNEDAQLLESHVAQSRIRGTYVWTLVEWTAAAVNDQIHGSRETVRPLFQIREPLLGGSGAVERSTRDMTAREERVESDTDDCGRRPTLVRDFSCKVVGLQGLSARPRI